MNNVGIFIATLKKKKKELCRSVGLSLWIGWVVLICRKEVCIEISCTS